MIDGSVSSVGGTSAPSANEDAAFGACVDEKKRSDEKRSDERQAEKQLAAKTPNAARPVVVARYVAPGRPQSHPGAAGGKSTGQTGSKSGQASSGQSSCQTASTGQPAFVMAAIPVRAAASVQAGSASADVQEYKLWLTDAHGFFDGILASPDLLQVLMTPQERDRVIADLAAFQGQIDIIDEELAKPVPDEAVLANAFAELDHLRGSIGEVRANVYQAWLTDSGSFFEVLLADPSFLDGLMTQDERDQVLADLAAAQGRIDILKEELQKTNPDQTVIADAFAALENLRDRIDGAKTQLCLAWHTSNGGFFEALFATPQSNLQDLGITQQDLIDINTDLAACRTQISTIEWENNTANPDDAIIATALRKLGSLLFGLEGDALGVITKYIDFTDTAINTSLSGSLLTNYEFFIAPIPLLGADAQAAISTAMNAEGRDVRDINFLSVLRMVRDHLWDLRDDRLKDPRPQYA